MRTVVLSRPNIGSVKRCGIQFDEGVPQTVEHDVATECLETGWFREVTADEDLSEFLVGLSGSDVGRKASNLFGKDDLSHKRILFRRRGGIGDHVFIAVLAQCIKDKYPSAYITLSVQAESVDFISCFDAIDSVITLDESTKYRVIRQYDYIMNFAETLNSEKHAAEDDKDYFQAHWERVGWEEPVPDPLPPLGICSLLTKGSVQAEAAKVLHQSQFGEEPYVVLLLGTSNPLKRLTLDQLKSIAHGLASSTLGDHRLRVLCLGGGEDRIFRSPNPWIAVYGDLSVVTAAELVRRSVCVVGADTGLLQFAGAIGVPTVSLWGPTDPKLNFYHYFGTRKILTAEERVACAPCRRLRTSFCSNFHSGYAECMIGFNVDNITTAVQESVAECPSHTSKLLTSEDVINLRKAEVGTYNVALLLDNADCFTGGGFYAWSLAKILASYPNVSVTVISDTPLSTFVYLRGDIVPKSSKLFIRPYEGDMRNWQSDVRFDLVIGTPPLLGNIAVEEQAKHDGLSALLVYETPNYIAEYRKGRDGKEDYWKEYKKSLLSCDKIFVISKTVKKKLYEWLPALRKKETDVRIIHPSVNVLIADRVMRNDDPYYFHKKDMIVMIARNMPYKGLDEALHVIANDLPGALGRPFEIVIIGQSVNKLKGQIQPVWRDRCEITLLENVSEESKWDYLSKAKVVVHPSDFEGFGIPVAEGLYAGCRVIVHPLPVLKQLFGDRVDYYTTANDLISTLLRCFGEWESIHKIEQDNDEAEHKLADYRRQYVKRRYTPSVVSKSLYQALEVDIHSGLKGSEGEVSVSLDQSIRLALVSPWNTACGIAETTKSIVTNFNFPYHVFSYTDIPVMEKDGAEVTRCWERRFSNYSGLLRMILDFEPNLVHFEHEHSLFQKESNLFALIQDIHDRGIRTAITLHTFLPSRFMDEVSDAVDAVITTKKHENVPDNFYPIHLPVPDFHELRTITKVEARKKLDLPTDDFIVGSFGMWQVHKGFKEFLETYDAVTHRIPLQVHYLVSGNYPEKSQYHQEVRRKFWELVTNKHIYLFGDYAPMEEVMTRLIACDVLVFNYSIAHYSSASAALRTGMCSGVPIVCTESPMFSEFTHEKEVLKIRFLNPGSLVEAVGRLYEDKELRSTLVENCDAYLSECSPKQIANQHLRLYRELIYGDEEEV